MNYPVIIIAGIALIALVIFLVRRNVKDEKQFEDQIKNDYPRPKDDKADVETDEVMK